MREHDFGPPLFPNGTPEINDETRTFLNDQQEAELTYIEANSVNPNDLVELDVWLQSHIGKFMPEAQAMLREILKQEAEYRGCGVVGFVSSSKGKNRQGEQIYRRPKVVVLISPGNNSRCFDLKGRPFQRKIDDFATEMFPEVPPEKAVERLNKFVSDILWVDYHLS